MGTIILCCGKVCSGKTRFAKKLKKENGCIHFSADEWMLHFYGEIEDREVFDLRLNQCKEMIYAIAEDLLIQNVDVVLDFGFWKRKEREDIRVRFELSGYKVIFVYFPVSFERQVELLMARERERNQTAYHFDLKTVELLNKEFEEPLVSEKVIDMREFSKLTSAST